MKSWCLIILALCASSSATSWGESSDDFFAWSTTAWRECVRWPSAPATRPREVRCTSILSGMVVDDGMCNAATKPCPYGSCSCGLVKCLQPYDGAETPDCVDDGAIHQEPKAEFVGCIDVPTLLPTSIFEFEAQDPDCMTCSGDDACHGGLPFFRKELVHGTDALCSHFCTTMDMDLSGLMGDGQCLCGATVANKGVYHLLEDLKAKMRPCLLLTKQHLLPNPTSYCPVKVFRYAGVYLDGAIPPELVQTKAHDDLYIDSLVAGYRINRLETDGPSRRLEAPPASEAGQASWTRKCYPSSCGPGNGPFVARQSEPPEARRMCSKSM